MRIIINYGISKAFRIYQPGVKYMQYQCYSPQWSKNAKVLMEGWQSKIHMACERGTHSDIKKQSIFQKCRGKFWTNFRENLDRVPPCPSTWHKHKVEWEKILKKDPISGQLHLHQVIAFLDNWNEYDVTNWRGWIYFVFIWFIKLKLISRNKNTLINMFVNWNSSIKTPSI